MPNPAVGKIQRSAGRPVGSNRRDSLARILPAARKLFAARGYAKTTFKEVGLAVGMTPAALYAYYPSKAALYQATCEHAQHLLLGQYMEVIGEGGSLREQLRKILLAGARAHDEDSSITGLLGAITLEMRRHPEVAELMLDRQNATFDLIAGAFAEAQRRGELSKRTSPEEQARVIMGAVTGVALFQYGLQRSTMVKSMEVFIDLIEARLFE